MNIVKKTTIYNLKYSGKGMVILTGIMLAIGLLIAGVVSTYSGEVSKNDAQFNGFEVTFAIFLFVNFIVSFKENFNHLNLNGVTRKNFYFANLLTILSTSFSMLLLMFVLNGFYRLMGVSSHFMTNFLYGQTSYPNLICFSLSLFILASMTGWLFSLLSYKFGRLMNIALAVSPAIVFTIIPLLAIKLSIGKQLLNMFMFYFGFIKGMGFAPVPNSVLYASLNFLITSIIFAIANWALIRKISVKI